MFSKVYFTGRAQISQDDIIAFLKDKMSSEGPDFPQWSEDTLYRVATKYLSLMTKFDFVTVGGEVFQSYSPNTWGISAFRIFL